MAGYIFNLTTTSTNPSETEIQQKLQEIFSSGVYSTIIKNPSNNVWRSPQEGTFADYITMQQGDYVYFFIKRKIYGVGRLVNINGDCKYKNYPNASNAGIYNYEQVRNNLLVNFNEGSPNNRWICTFIPSPYFFRNGVDMDDILSSNPTKFRMLRAFWKLSFVKIDDEENKALMDIILKRNEDGIHFPNRENVFSHDDNIQQNIASNINNNYILDYRELLRPIGTDDGRLRHEMALEAGTLSQLVNRTQNAISVFGSWDYISHQVVASPMKPIDYMDKMDIFGYRYIPNFTTISKYLVAELKKDEATEEDINQLLKYIDFVNQEYTHGDYSMISAFLIAYDFSENVIEHCKTVGIRRYSFGNRPTQVGSWSNINLVTYRFINDLIFERVI